MKNSKSAVTLLAAAALLLTAGQGAFAEEWSIDLHGTTDTAVSAERFDAAKEHTTHYTEVEVEEEGSTVTYEGMPLWFLVAMVDDGEESHPYRFAETAWEEGYEVTLTASDGYSATFDTSEYAPDTMYLVDRRGGSSISPRIVGDVSKKLWVKNIAEIEVFSPAATGSKSARKGPPDFTLKLTVGEDSYSYPIARLEQMPIYTEGRGSYTTSAGTTYTNTYGGVDLEALLGRYLALKPDTAVTFKAMDGYEMTYTGKTILESGSGTWVLAFKRNGEYMPKDPGYIRTVKIGPDTPNIEGHNSVKMVEEIAVQAEGFKDFELEMRGKMDFTLDRSTIQSGVSCHTRTVDFDRKDNQAQYTGIPLYLMLAYVDDPKYAPHKQTDKSIKSYDAEAAEEGYTVKITASDGYSIELDSRKLHENDDVILAMYKEGEVLPDREWPLILVWDKNAERVPDGIKPIRSIVKIELDF
jgi:DMSO/TMAO reductase YedYZ molybdopterin-dependent catalytic subunit